MHYLHDSVCLEGAYKSYYMHGLVMFTINGVHAIDAAIPLKANGRGEHVTLHMWEKTKDRVV